MTDEQQVRDLIGRWAAAVHDGGLPAVLAEHAGGIILFEVPPPGQGVRGVDACRQTWPGFVEWQACGALLEIESLEVAAGADVAFAFALVWCGTAERFERDPEQRLRLTVGLRKEAGRWTVTQEHHSFAAAAESPQVLPGPASSRTKRQTEASAQDPTRKVRRPMATRDGSAQWTGDLKTGSGELTVGAGVWTSAYSGRSRFAGVLPGFEDGDGTNPEELLAAAHAACFSMALSLALSDAGHPPSSIQTTARVHLRVVDGAPAIQQIDLNTEADVPGLDQEEFQDHAEQAKTSCIISRALGGVEQINLSATLAS